MKNDSKLTGNGIFALSGIILCMSLVSGCSRSAKINSDTMADRSYEEVYSADLEIGTEKIPLEIWTNTNLCTEGIIKIDGQEIPINPESESVALGYVHTEPKVYDFTGDGKEEIALIASGGASGSVQAVQVFGNTDGQWNEIALPSDIYDSDPEFVKKTLGELNIKMDDSVYDRYRTVSFDGDKILIENWLFEDSDSGSTDIGIIQRELVYASDEKEFVLGDTLFLSNVN